MLSTRTLAGGDKNVNYWTTLLIKLGYPIVIDDAGSGTIHSNEPIQCFITAKKYAKVLEVIENKNWKAVGENSAYIIISRIIDDIAFSGNLEKWKNVINKFHKDIKKSLLSSILRNSSVLSNIKKTDCEILQIQDYLEKDNSYIKNLNINYNEQLVEYLKPYAQNDNVADFLYFYISDNSLEVRDKNFLLKIISSVFKDENKYKNYNATYFRVLVDVAERFFSQDSKVVNFFCIKLLKVFSSKNEVEDGYIRSLCNLLLLNTIDKQSKIWFYIEKEIKTIKNSSKKFSFYETFLKKVKDTDVNLSNKASEWFLEQVMDYFNRYIVSRISKEFFYFFKNNTSLIQMLSIEKVCEMLFISSIEEYDQTVLENCLDRLNQFDKQQVADVMKEVLTRISYTISSENIVKNFINIPKSMKKFFLDSKQFVDLLTRSYMKTSHANIQDLQDLIGQDNITEWANNNKEHITELSNSPEILNNLSKIIDFDFEKYFLSTVGEIKKFHEFFQYIVYFSRFNKQNREKMLEHKQMFDTILYNFDIPNLDYQKVFEYCDQLLQQDENIDSPSIIIKVKQYILQNKTFLNNIIKNIQRYSVDREYLFAVTNDFLPIHYLSKSSTVGSVGLLLAGFELYDSNMKKVNFLNLQAYNNVFMKKSDVELLLSKGGETLPPDYLIKDILDETKAKSNVVDLKAYIDIFSDTPDLVPLIRDSVVLLSFIQTPDSDPSQLYTLDDDDAINDQAKKAIPFNSKDNDSIFYANYPLFIKAEYYQKLFGPLPKEYFEIKNNPQEKISQQSKDQVLKYIENTSSNKITMTYDGDKYIIFPSYKMNEFGLFFPDLFKRTGDVFVSANEINTKTTQQIFYVKLSKLQSLMSIPQDLIENKIDKNVLEKMLQAFENPIPDEIVQNRPVKTMQYGGTKLVLLGTGLHPDGWAKALKLDSTKDVWAFDENSWYSYSNGMSSDVYYALEKSLWESITGKKVPEEYYLPKLAELYQDYKKLIQNSMYSVPPEMNELLTKEINIYVENFLTLPDGQRLVLLGRGILAGWANVLQSENVVMWVGGSSATVWSMPDKAGNIEQKFYAVFEQDWENYTNQTVDDNYYKEYENPFYSQNSQSQSDDKEDDGLI